MANTYTLINSTSLSSSAASVTFSAIPATYDDVLVKISARCDVAAYRDEIKLTFNSITSGYSRTSIEATGSTASSERTSAAPSIRMEYPAANATSNTFGSIEIYLPKYTASQNKPMGIDEVLENDSSTQNKILGTAGLLSNTDAVTSIVLTPANGSFVSGSTFWLYGIKNS